ncbi:MAG: LysM peptidoglycan-binding domain-containing protein [Anaerolineales bacterium]
MKTIIRSLALLSITSLLLASCTLFGSSTETATNALPEVQATQSLTDLVSIELTVQYDIAAVYNTVGQTVRFKYLVKMVKNDLPDGTPANVAIIGVTATCPALNTINNLNDRFDPGEVLECTGDYLITQADLDKGSISNVATATAYSVSSTTVTTTVPTVSPKALTLSKTANPTTYGAANQQVTFTYTVTNSGTVPLGPAQFTITDTGVNNNQPFNCGNADATIAPGATLNCNATYTVTAADMNATTISHSATVSGNSVTSQPVALSLTKGTAPAVSSGTTVQHTVREGEWLWQIARCYAADPNQTVSANPQVDPKNLKIGSTVTIPTVGTVGNRVVHAPPELCVQLHTVQSGDTWTSIADKYGADPGLTQLSNSNNMIVGKQVKVPLYTKGLNIPLSNTTTSPTTTSAMSLTVTPNTTVYTQVDQIITFNYVIKNNGSTTLGPTQFMINDALMSPTAFKCGLENSTIAPGSTLTCSNAYKTTQNDMNVANLPFSTTASGTNVPTTASVATTLTKGSAQLSLTITPSATTYNTAGQTITFTYTIKNSGTTDLGPTQFFINDPLMNPTTLNCGASNTTLAPNATVQCTNNYTITDADLGAVNIQFSSSAGGTGAPTSQSVPTTLTKQ